MTAQEAETYFEALTAEEELRSYQLQYLYAVNHYSKSFTKQLLDRISKDLSSGMYGNIYTFETAKTAITGDPS